MGFCFLVWLLRHCIVWHAHHPQLPTYWFAAHPTCTLLDPCRKIFNCFRGQTNTIKAKKAAKNAAETAKTPEPELPKALDPSDPKAEPPVKFLSLSSSGLAHDIPANLAHNNRMYKQGSGGSNQSSSGIPVGPVTGPAHSVTPWATCEDDSLGRDQTGPVAPTGASLAGVQQGGLYRDSNSFRQWAASAVHTGGEAVQPPWLVLHEYVCDQLIGACLRMLICTPTYTCLTVDTQWHVCTGSSFECRLG